MSKDIGEQGREKDGFRAVKRGLRHLSAVLSCWILSHSPLLYNLLNSIILKFRALSLLALFLMTKWINFHDSDDFYVSIHLQGQFTFNIFQTNHCDCLTTCSSKVTFVKSFKNLAYLQKSHFL